MPFCVMPSTLLPRLHPKINLHIPLRLLNLYNAMQQQQRPNCQAGREMAMAFIDPAIWQLCGANKTTLNKASRTNCNLHTSACLPPPPSHPAFMNQPWAIHTFNPSVSASPVTRLPQLPSHPHTPPTTATSSFPLAPPVLYMVIPVSGDPYSR